MKEKDFDCYQRYGTLKSLLDAAFADISEGSVVSVLDVGSGTSRLSRDFLGSRYNVTCSDVDVDQGSGTEVVPLQPGQPLPFDARAFDTVIAMDVLEHVRPEDRQLFVTECIRVARDVCILAAPTTAREVEDAEARVYAVHRSYLGNHAYFEEHLSYGLPIAAEIEKWIAGQGAALVTLPNVPLLAWETFSCLDFVGYSDPQTRELTMDAHFLENATFPPLCNNGAHYRMFYVACRAAETRGRVEQRVEELRRLAVPLAAETPLALTWQVIAASCRQLREARSHANELEVQLAQASAKLAAVRAELDSALHEKQRTEAYLQQQLHLLHEHQAALAAILESRSWRYMGGFRKAAQGLRRMRDKWRAPD